MGFKVGRNEFLDDHERVLAESQFEGHADLGTRNTDRE